jgi:hypothetical protein
VAGAGATAVVDADASAGVALEDLGGALAGAAAEDWARELVAESRTRSGGCGAGTPLSTSRLVDLYLSLYSRDA